MKNAGSLGFPHFYWSILPAELSGRCGSNFASRLHVHDYESDVAALPLALGEG